MFISMDVFRYNKLSREIREVACKIKALDQNDPFRTDCSAKLLEKCYILGLISTKWDLSLCGRVSENYFSLSNYQCKYFLIYDYKYIIKIPNC